MIVVRVDKDDRHDISSKAVVTPKLHHVSHAVFLPFPAIDDVWSHPVKAWKPGKALALSSPKRVAMVCTEKYFKHFPVPNDTQSSSKDSLLYVPIARTNTSVSMVLIMTLCKPWRPACSTRRSIMVSASLCEHGASLCMLASVRTLRTSTPFCRDYLFAFIDCSFSRHQLWHTLLDSGTVQLCSHHL